MMLSKRISICGSLSSSTLKVSVERTFLCVRRILCLLGLRRANVCHFRKKRFVGPSWVERTANWLWRGSRKSTMEKEDARRVDERVLSSWNPEILRCCVAVILSSCAVSWYKSWKGNETRVSAFSARCNLLIFNQRHWRPKQRNTLCSNWIAVQTRMSSPYFFRLAD